MISLYTLAEELSKDTVGKQVERSDFELGLETLLRMTNGEDGAGIIGTEK